jgi:hypothetical protein|tara:strand:- start:106 stop:381 length:276 start_codon:yes stop_codon:yes gene_type:complete
MDKFSEFINKEESLDEAAIPPNLHRLLRLGLVDKEDLERMRLAIKTGNNSLTVPRLRDELYKLLQFFIDAVEDDNEIFRRLRNRVQRGEFK